MSSSPTVKLGGYSTTRAGLMTTACTITRRRVEHMLERDAPHLLKRNQPPRLPD